MTKWETFLRRTKTAFGLVCFVLALHMTITEMARFVENNDSSVIQFKPFNGNAKQPTFSFCFHTVQTTLLNTYSKSIIDELHVDNEELLHLLKGDQLLDETSTKKLRRIASLDPHSGNLNKMILKFRSMSMNSSIFSSAFKQAWDKIGGEERKSLFGQNFYVNYKDVEEICFTRKWKSNSYSQPIKRDMVTLELGALKSLYHHLRIYLHYPGQLISTKLTSNPAYKLLSNDVTNLTYNIFWDVANVNILRKRPSQHTTCDEDIQDDDNKMLQTITKKLRCIPNYLKTMIEKQEASLPMCQTMKQFADVYWYFKNLESMKTYPPPCLELLMPKNVRETKSNLGFLGSPKLNFYVNYTEERYQDIKNVEDFPLLSVFSSIGGFLGIFIGTSLLQIPDLLQDAWKNYGRKGVNICRVAAHGFKQFFLRGKLFLFKAMNLGNY